jgi:hypothetical protein
MKRTIIILSLLLALILLSGCFPQPEVDTTDADMATRVAYLLTAMPPQQGAATQEVPVEEPVDVQPAVEVTLAPTDTAEPEPTATEMVLPPTETRCLLQLPFRPRHRQCRLLCCPPSHWQPPLWLAPGQPRRPP